MIKILGREVDIIINEQSREFPGDKNSRYGVRCLLKGDSKPRWVSYDCVAWESMDF